MKVVKFDKIKIKDIKYIENSRLRNKEDVGELMQTLQQHGQLQNIDVRAKDHVLICGYRRVRAAQKLGWTELNANFCDDITNEDILVLNLIENIQRKDIGSIEIGRMCKELEKKGMTPTEISIKLGINVSRVRGCLVAYQSVVGTKFEDIVIFGKRGKEKGISETVLWQVWNSLSRARKLTKSDWKIILKAMEKGNITTAHIPQIRKILLTDKKITIEKAIKMVDKCFICHSSIPFALEELNIVMTQEKVNSAQELITHIIRNYNKNLLY